MTERARHRPDLDVKEEAPDTPVGEHTHEQPRNPVVTGLMIGLVILSLAVGWLGLKVYELQKGQGETTMYLGDARDRRDTQNEELNARIDEAVCDVLNQLPAGGLFDPIREQYRCGPGIPVDELDPQAAQNLADILGEIEDAQPAETAPATSEPALPTSAPDEMPPGAPPGAQPSPMGQAPTSSPAPTSAPVTPAPTAAPTSTAPPLVDLSTVTDPLCEAVGICL